MKKPLLSLLVALFAIALARPSFAEETTRAKVKHLYESATNHYNLSEYADALTEYKEAYRLRSDPAFLFNIAQCHRQLGDPQAASREYRAFLREDPKAKNREAVQKLIEEMDRATVEKRNSQPPLNVEPPTEQPTTETPPPPTTVTTPPPPVVAPPPPVAHGPDGVGIGLAAGGGAVAIVGIVLVVLSVNYASQSTDATQKIDLGAREDLLSKSNTMGVAGYVSIGVGGAALIGGIVKLALGRKAKTGDVGFNLEARPGLAAATLSGSF